MASRHILGGAVGTLHLFCLLKLCPVVRDSAAALLQRLCGS